MSKGGKRIGAGRKPKNSENKKITFKPSQAALDVYNGWENKAQSLDSAIINYQSKDKEQ